MEQDFYTPLCEKILWHATSEQEKVEIGKVFGKVPVFISPNGIDNDEFQSAVVLEKHEIIKNSFQVILNQPIIN